MKRFIFLFFNLIFFNYLHPFVVKNKTKSEIAVFYEVKDYNLPKKFKKVANKYSDKIDNFLADYCLPETPMYILSPNETKEFEFYFEAEAIWFADNELGLNSIDINSGSLNENLNTVRLDFLQVDLKSKRLVQSEVFDALKEKYFVVDVLYKQEKGSNKLTCKLYAQLY